jgi:hypothetical protein
MPAGDAPYRDWIVYDLTSSGRRAVEVGRLPEVELLDLLGAEPGTYLPRDFALLLQQSSRVHARYGNPFTVLAISANGMTTSQDRDRTLGFVAQSVREVVRSSDSVTAVADQAFVHLPETDAEGAEVVRGRLENQLRGLVRSGVEVTVQAHPPNDADLIVEQIRAGVR